MVKAFGINFFVTIATLISLAAGTPARAFSVTYEGVASVDAGEVGGFGYAPFTSVNNVPYTVTISVNPSVGGYDATTQTYFSDINSNPVSGSLTINGHTALFNFPDGSSANEYAEYVASTGFFRILESDFNVESVVKTVDGQQHDLFFWLQNDTYNIEDINIDTQTTLAKVSGRLLQTSVTATPLPATLPLFATGLASLGWLARRKRK